MASFSQGVAELGFSQADAARVERLATPALRNMITGFVTPVKKPAAARQSESRKSRRSPRPTSRRRIVANHWHRSEHEGVFPSTPGLSTKPGQTTTMELYDAVGTPMPCIRRVPAKERNPVLGTANDPTSAPAPDAAGDTPNPKHAAPQNVTELGGPSPPRSSRRRVRTGHHPSLRNNAVPGPQNTRQRIDLVQGTHATKGRLPGPHVDQRSLQSRHVQVALQPGVPKSRIRRSQAQRWLESIARTYEARTVQGRPVDLGDGKWVSIHSFRRILGSMGVQVTTGDARALAQHMGAGQAAGMQGDSVEVDTSAFARAVKNYLHVPHSAEYPPAAGRFETFVDVHGVRGHQSRKVALKEAKTSKPPPPPPAHSRPATDIATKAALATRARVRKQLGKRASVAKTQLLVHLRQHDVDHDGRLTDREVLRALQHFCGDVSTKDVRSMMRVAGQEGGDPHRWDAEPHMIRGATPDIASNAFMRWMLAGDTDDAAPAQRGPSTAAGKKAMCDMARPRRSSRRHYPGKWQRPTTPLVPGTPGTQPTAQKASRTSAKLAPAASKQNTASAARSDAVKPPAARACKVVHLASPPPLPRRNK